MFHSITRTIFSPSSRSEQFSKQNTNPLKVFKVLFDFRRGSIETRSQEHVLHEFYANKRRTGELKKSELYIEEMLQDHINGEL